MENEMSQNIPSIKLGRREITNSSKPYIIAEVGVNHEGSISRAYKLIDEAKVGGADAVKFQSYKADTLASKLSPSYWDLEKEPTKSQHELFKKYDSFNADDYVNLAQYCKKVNVDFVSTPFDDDSIDFLFPLMPFYKIASADITNIPFLRKIAKKGKPVVMSTGASTLAEIDTAVNTVKEYGAQSIALLHCILNYPTKNTDANIGMIASLRRLYPEYIVGYSDHTLPDEFMTPLVTAYLKGAVIIEKHFTDDKSLPGNDHYHAMDKNDLLTYKSIITNIDSLLGQGSIKKPLETEKPARLNARRSIVLARDMKKGSIIKETDLIYKRPGFGISPGFWDDVVGKKVSEDLKEDTLLKWSDLRD